MANSHFSLSLFPSLIISFFSLAIQSSFYPTFPMFTSGQVINTIDSCWPSNPNWAANCQTLADCSVGFGKDVNGGKNGKTYVVSSPTDDPENPTYGTFRYGDIQAEPLWIIFAKDIFIKLENELIMNSNKTIDGRGGKSGNCLWALYYNPRG